MQQKLDAATRELATRIVEHHVMRRCVHPGIVVLGAWLIVGPATMGVRSHAVLWSDVVAGALLVWLGFMFAPRHARVPWVTALIGVWLLFAPLVFWTASPTAYVNDTLIGAFVIVLAMVMPHSILGETRRAGTPLSHAFWRGGHALQRRDATRRDASVIASPPDRRWHAATRGMGMPLTLIFSAIVGVWIMFSPTVFRVTARAADSDHVVGALVVTYSMIAMAEVARSLRFTNMALGLWLVLTPWMLTGSTLQGALNDRAAGLVLIVLAIPRGAIRERYGRDACIAS